MRDGRLEAEDVAAYDRRPDGFNAVRLILAMIDDDFAAADDILLRHPVVPLLSGLAAVALMLGEQAAGYDTDRLRKVLDLLALSPNLDRADTADDYRARVVP